MSDFEILYLVLMILGIVVSLMMAYIESTKKVTALGQRIRLPFCD